MKTESGAFSLQTASIHPKRWFPRFQESADNFEFSAERLSEIAKSIKITLFAELLTVISPNYVQSLLNFSMKTLTHSIFSKKCPIDTKFFVAITHFFRRFFETEKHIPQTLSLLECMSVLEVQFNFLQVFWNQNDRDGIH